MASNPPSSESERFRLTREWIAMQAHLTRDFDIETLTDTLLDQFGLAYLRMEHATVGHKIEVASRKYETARDAVRYLFSREGRLF